jgi:hypothetical protein
MEKYVMNLSTLTLSLVAVALVTTPVYAEGGPLAVWGQGKPTTSTYTDVYVPHIIETLQGQALSGYQWGGVSEGTLDNAQRVTENPTNIAIGQLDLLRDLNGKIMPNGKPYAFTILNDNIGPECLYLVTSEPGYNTFGDFLGNAFQVSVATGGPNSGSFGTLMNLSRLYPDMEQMTYDHVGSALDIVNSVNSRKYTHGFFVMRPDPQSATFKAIADAKMTIIPVVDFGLQDDYQFIDLKVQNGFLFGAGKTVTTSCTSVALIAGSASSEAAAALTARDKKRLEVTIQRLSSLTSDTLRPSISSWADMWDNLKIVTVDQAKVLMEASKVALDDILAKQGQ